MKKKENNPTGGALPPPTLADWWGKPGPEEEKDEEMVPPSVCAENDVARKPTAHSTGKATRNFCSPFPKGWGVLSQCIKGLWVIRKSSLDRHTFVSNLLLTSG